MGDVVVPTSVQGTDPSDGSSTSRRSHRMRSGAAIVLFVVFLVLVAFSVWLYPRRAVINRPAPFSLTMISAEGPEIGAFDVIPLTIVPNPAYSNPSDVNVIVEPVGHDVYGVHVSWTYTPSMCSQGENRVQGEIAGCAPTSKPYEVAGSELNVSIPIGATILHCHACPQGRQHVFAEQDSTVRPEPYLPDASVLTTSTPALPVTASWKFEIRDTAFAWAANGLSAEASLPVVNFLNNGNVGYGDVTVTYRIPGGNQYDWNDGPDPDKLTWSEPVSAATTAVQVAGIDNSAASSDTRDVLIVGILLGTAGGALVGSIQEFAHARSEREGAHRRP